jgi:PAS domain S-box-containing protein
MAGKRSSEGKEQKIRELGHETHERKRAEEALRDSEERYRALVEASPDVIFSVSIEDGTITSLNPAFEKITGWPNEKWLGKPFSSIIHSDDLPIDKEKEKFEQVLRGEVTAPFELRVPSKSGEFLVGEFVAAPEIKDGKVVSLFGFVRDITERKRAEEALRKSEERYRTILEGIEDGCFEVDLAGNFTFFNDSMCRISALSSDELMGMNYQEYTSAETGDKMYKVFNEVYKTGKPGKIMDYEVIRKDGNKYVLELSTSLVRDPGTGEAIGFRGVVRDVTERKRAEEEKKTLEAQLQQAKKMESIGTLSGGIAHDFNNLLMGILGNVSLALLETDSSEPQYERLENIKQHVQDAAELTKQLLGFARGGKYQVKPIDLNELVGKSSKMFGRTKKEITIHSEFQEGIWMVDADPGQIEQILLNLYVNAWHAMPGGGTLYLKTENVTLDESYIKPFIVAPGNYVRTSVTDTGVGMDKETQQRIFDPFFTTKEMGRGTGLGLASAYGIVKNHGGLINVYSEEGRGTTFTVYLPASEAEEAVIEESKKYEGSSTRTETVLLVDDEGMIIDVGSQMLRKIGCKVLVARGGKEAIEEYKLHKDSIDIVILDMIMPEMGGGETYDLLKGINPDVKVLLSSGYSLSGEAEEILKRGCNGFIQKPFNMEQLSRKIGEILDQE